MQYEVDWHLLHRITGPVLAAYPKGEDPVKLIQEDVFKWGFGLFALEGTMVGTVHAFWNESIQTHGDAQFNPALPVELLREFVEELEELRSRVAAV